MKSNKFIFWIDKYDEKTKKNIQKNRKKMQKQTIQMFNDWNDSQKIGWGLKKICWGLVNITVPRVRLTSVSFYLCFPFIL